MPRTPDLSGVWLKLERAQAHIQAVRQQTVAFTERDPAPFGFRTEITDGPGNSRSYSLYAVVREAPPPELALPVGDAIQNMRSSLDHLAYQFATSKGRRSNKLQFPIFLDECRFKVLGPERMTSITGDERALIERVQPFNATDPATDNPLAILRKLSNLDKHRLLIPLITAVSATDVWVASDNADIRWTHLEGGPVEHDAEIVAFTATPQDPSKDMEVHAQSGLQIELADTGASFEIGVVDVLAMIHFHIGHMVEMWFRHGFLPPTLADLRGPSLP